MTQIINPPSAAGIEYGAGGGTEDYLQKADASGNLVNAAFEETVSGEIRSTAKKLHLRGDAGEYFVFLLKLTSQGYGLSCEFQMGEGLIINAPYFILRDASNTNQSSRHNFADNQIVYSAAPVYEDVAAAQMTADGTITVTKPPRRIILSADSGGWIIQGLAANQIDGMSVILENPTTNSFFLDHENGTATAANRFNLPGEVDYTIPTYSSVTLTYNGTLARWMVANYITP